MSDKKYHEAESLKEAMWKNFYREEDKWESTAEAEFLEAKGGQPRHWFQLGFSAGLDAVVKADPVPQEMSAREYLQTMRPICEDGRNCGKCPLSYNNNGAGINCQDYAAYYPEEAVAIVEAWAREHPEERSKE